MDYKMAGIGELISEVNVLTIMLDSRNISRGLRNLRRYYLRQALQNLGKYELLGRLNKEQIDFLYSVSSQYYIRCTLSDKLQTLSSFINITWHKLDEVKRTECTEEFIKLLSVLYKNYAVIVPKIAVYRRECIAKAYNTVMGLLND